MTKKQTQSTTSQVEEAKVEEAKVEETKVEEVKVRVSIGSTSIKLILDNPTWTNQQVLDEVKKQFPSAQTTMACIAWYKSKLRKEGKIGQRVFKKKVVEQVTAE